MKKITVLLAEDHPVARAGLRAVLASDFKLIETENGRQAVKLAKKFKPDVAVLDLAMPMLNGFEAAREIARFSPGTKSIIFSSYGEDELVERSVKAEVMGYVLKQMGTDVLIKAIREVHRGNKFFFPRRMKRYFAQQEISKLKELSKTSSKSAKVFICYAKQDVRKAHNLFRYLVKQGMDPWQDKEKLVSGDPWEFEIKEAVTTSDAFVVLLRPEFNEIGFRQQEVKWALQALAKRPPSSGFIIPYIVEPIQSFEDLPDWCRPIHLGKNLKKRTTKVALLAAIQKHCATIGRESRRVQSIELTSREAEALQLIAEGFSNEQIAAELCISVVTVEKHRKSVMSKLGIHNVVGLTRYAIAKGLVERGIPAGFI